MQFAIAHFFNPDSSPNHHELIYVLVYRFAEEGTFFANRSTSLGIFVNKKVENQKN